MNKKPDLSDDDIALFKQAVADSQPLKQDKIIPETPKPFPVPARADKQAVLNELDAPEFDEFALERGDTLLFYRPGLQRRTFKKLRRGQFNIEAELDLHGMTVDKAKIALAEFIKRCLSRNKHCVRIIHGKGLGSKNNKPVIKNKLNHWLPKRNDVLAYCSARQVDGGTGAIYLLLKK